MASERRVRIKTLVMVLAMVVCANAGDLMLKRGMSQIGAVQLTASGLAEAFRLTVTNGTISSFYTDSSSSIETSWYASIPIMMKSHPCSSSSSSQGFQPR